MADVIMVAILLAFFASAVLLVKACDRIIGVEELTVIDGGLGEDEVDSSVAA
jgi:hypothetical protein